MTTGYSRNSALNLAWYMAHPQFGLGATIGALDGINEDDLIASANICDETVPKVSSGTEKRYTCNGVITLDQTPQTIIQAMLTAMAGDAVCRGGEWSLLAGAWRPPVSDLHRGRRCGGRVHVADARACGGQFQRGQRGKFISPSNDWQPDDFPAYESDVYLAEDNNERNYADISLPFTTGASQAQRLAKIHLEKKRRQQSVSLTGRTFDIAGHGRRRRQPDLCPLGVFDEAVRGAGHVDRHRGRRGSTAAPDYRAFAARDIIR